MRNMKALILNSGIGSRMGAEHNMKPKCMIEIANNETLLSRQLRQLLDMGITDVIVTTGAHSDMLVEYCQSLDLPLQITFVYNPRYMETDYIYSIYCARDVIRDHDLLMMHGDIVFENGALEAILQHEESCMAVSTTASLSEKDFKAVLNSNSVTANP